MSLASNALAPNALVLRPTAQYDRSRGALMVRQWGEDLTIEILRALNEMFPRRNADGSRFSFCITSAITYQKYGWLAITVDTERLYHIPLEALTTKRVEETLSRVAHRPVIALAVPGAYAELNSTLVYLVLLRGLPPKAAAEPSRLPTHARLDLSKQPTPLHVPIGVTERQAQGLWLSLTEIDAALIGGARRMGKTNLVHSWIAALLDGGQAQLVLFDGKSGLEFARYASHARVRHVEDKLAPVLAEMSAEMARRTSVLRSAGAANIGAYQSESRDKPMERLMRLVLIVDELAHALQEPGVEELLVDLAARGGAAGIHLVVATNQCRAEVVTSNLKVNLSTRIAFAVPQASDSRVILDAAHAAQIGNTKGRLVLRWENHLIAAQAFEMELPIAPVSKPAPVLNARELRIARAALEQGGVFRARQIASAVGEDKNRMTEIARAWQARGWLSDVQRSGKGNGGRLVTDTLRNLIQ